MKIAYFINTFKSSNWGGQATSNGLKYLLNQEYPSASFHPLDLPELRFKKVKILRKYFEQKLAKALLNDDKIGLLRYLKKLNITEDIFDSYTHICFNGEGAVHYKSGHLIRFMGLLYLAKSRGKIVASVNQTIDFNRDKKLENLVSKIYNMCDFVSVREPLSQELAEKIGIDSCRLIPDGVYGLPKMDKYDIEKRVERFNLPKEFITLTGSSILKRDGDSLEKISKLVEAIQKSRKETPIIFMSSTKTDLYLAQKLRERYGLKVIESSEADYKDAIAIISKSQFLAGGRQHPNIFAYMYKVPYIGFDGNTFKNRGVARLQGYPIPLLSWESSIDDIYRTIESLKTDEIKFKDIEIKKFDIFGKEV